MATGQLSFLGINRQNSFGTALGSYHWTPFVSESLVHNIETLVSQGIRATLVEGVHMQGLESAAGAVVVEPHPIQFGHFLRAVFGQASSTNLTSVAGFQDYRHTFNPRNADFSDKTPLPVYTLTVHRNVGTTQWQFTDSVLSRLEFSIEAGAFVRSTANWLCRTTSLQVKDTPTFIDDFPWTFAVASASIGGVAVDFLETLTIAFENAVEGVGIMSSRRWGKFGRTAFAQVLISGRMDLGTLDQYNEYVAASETNMSIFLASTITSGAYMNIVVPRLRWTGIPVQVGGPGRLTFDFNAKGIFHTNSATALTFILTNTVAAYQ